MTPFPTGGREIVERLTRLFPDLFVNEDDKQRQLTTKIGEQFAFTYGPRWGNKKRTGLGDEFRSKDSVAVQEEDGTTSVFDMFSSGLAILVHDGDEPIVPTHAHLPPSEATFMPCVPTNHLGGNPLPGETPDPSDPDLEARVESLEDFRATQRIVNEQTRDADDARTREIAALTARVAHLEAELAKPMQGQVVGRTGDKYAHSHPVAITVDVSRVG